MTLVKPSAGLLRRATVAGHLAPILKLAWAPGSGDTLASCSEDGTATIWKLSDRALVSLHSVRIDGWIEAIAWSPDGALLAYAGREGTIRFLTSETGQVTSLLVRHTAPVRTLAWTRSGDFLAAGSDDGSVLLSRPLQQPPWSQVLKAGTEPIRCVRWSPDTRYLATCADDFTVRLWDVQTGLLVRTLRGHEHWIWDIDWHPTLNLLTSCSEDRTVKLWQIETGRCLQTIEDYSDGVLAGQFSPYGELFCSAQRSRVVFRSARTWAPVAEITYEAQDWGRVSFAPRGSTIASVGEHDHSIDVWDFDPNLLLANANEPPPKYVSARIALLGERGVGKSGLAWRMKHGDFKPQESSHGQRSWVVEGLGETLPDGTTCEAVLWDFAGQQDYRIIQSLFLEEVDLALLLFDSSSDGQSSLKSVEYWIKQLGRNRSTQCPLVLVGAQADRGVPAFTGADLREFCAAQKIVGGYVSTSALTGEGIDELTARIKNLIDWPRLSSTVFSATFQAVKAVLEQIATEPTLLSLSEFGRELRGKYPAMEITKKDVMGGLENAVKHGRVSLLRTPEGEIVLLTQPDLLGNLAASFILLARNDALGLGVLDETMLLSGKYEFPQLKSLETRHHPMLLDAVTSLCLKNNLCFRERSGQQALLVFPALRNQRPPGRHSKDLVDDVSYVVTGTTQNVYAALVVLVSYTRAFIGMEHWQNEAQFDMGEGQICGVQQIQELDGELHLLLYYSVATSVQARKYFQALIELLLFTRKVKVDTYPAVDCPNCARRQQRSVVVEYLRDRYDRIHCPACGTEIQLPRVTQGPPGGSLEDDVRRDKNSARLKTQYEEALTPVRRLATQRKAPPTCFVSYAHAPEDDRRWVENLVHELLIAGVDVWWDEGGTTMRDGTAGRFVSRLPEADFVLVVGTPEYLRRANNAEPASPYWLGAERDLIDKLLGAAPEQRKQRVLPVLLHGEPDAAFPALVSTRERFDFREKTMFFPALFDLVLRLFGLRPDLDQIRGLRKTLHEEATRRGNAAGFGSRPA